MLLTIWTLFAVAQDGGKQLLEWHMWVFLLVPGCFSLLTELTVLLTPSRRFVPRLFGTSPSIAPERDHLPPGRARNWREPLASAMQWVGLNSLCVLLCAVPVSALLLLSHLLDSLPTLTALGLGLAFELVGASSVVGLMWHRRVDQANRRSLGVSVARFAVLNLASLVVAVLGAFAGSRIATWF